MRDPDIDWAFVAGLTIFLVTVVIGFGLLYLGLSLASPT